MKERKQKYKIQRHKERSKVHIRPCVAACVRGRTDHLFTVFVKAYDWRGHYILLH